MNRPRFEPRGVPFAPKSMRHSGGAARTEHFANPGGNEPDPAYGDLCARLRTLLSFGSQPEPLPLKEPLVSNRPESHTAGVGREINHLLKGAQQVLGEQERNSGLPCVQNGALFGRSQGLLYKHD